MDPINPKIVYSSTVDFLKYLNDRQKLQAEKLTKTNINANKKAKTTTKLEEKFLME